MTLDLQYTSCQHANGQRLVWSLAMNEQYYRSFVTAHSLHTKYLKDVFINLFLYLCIYLFFYVFIYVFFSYLFIHSFSSSSNWLMDFFTLRPGLCHTEKTLVLQICFSRQTSCYIHHVCQKRIW